MTCSGPPREDMSQLLVQGSFHRPGRWCLTVSVLPEYFRAYHGWQQVSGGGSSLWALNFLLDTEEPDSLKLPPLPVQWAFLLLVGSGRARARRGQA